MHQKNKINVVILGVSLIFMLFLSVDTAYGFWIPKSPQELLEQSHTIIVGDVTAVNIVETTQTTQIEGQFDEENIPFEGSFSSSRVIHDFGDSKLYEITYASNIDELTVDIEKYLKNLKIFENTTINVRAPINPASPTYHHEVKSNFELGDRVLLYFTQPYTDNMSYSLESFVIPEQCDPANVLTQERFWKHDDVSYVAQNGVEQSVNGHKFVANMPITFTYGKDTETLFGKNFTVNIEINKFGGNSNSEIIFNNVIELNSKPCEWIAYTDFEFTPMNEGQYSINTIIQDEEFSSSTSWISRDIFINSDKILSPFKQHAMGIPFDEIQCRESLLVVEKHDGTPACVTSSTADRLIERGWAV